MDARFEQVFTHPENAIFQVVFFPDRIYHARYLNATRSSRYRYNVTEVRSGSDITIMKGDVYLGALACAECFASSTPRSSWWSRLASSTAGSVPP